MSDDTYRLARERLERFIERDGPNISEYGRSLLLEHGRRMPRATILLHGLSASPRQFVAVATQLHERGHNVFVPRLPRHGHTDRLSEALATMNAAQLKACANDAVAIANGLGEQVFIAGFSLGGLLAAYIGQTQPVRRVVALSPFLGVSFLPGRWRLSLAQWIFRFPNRFLWWDPFLRERQLPEHGYPRYATHAVAHALSLAHEVLDAAQRREPKADELVLAINTRDPAVNNRAIEMLARRWTERKPQAIHVHRFTDLPLAHDIVEPKRYPGVAQRVGPALVELIDR
jgi:pimeloyl-ACP methyl ester carboxylesterase